MTGSLDVVAVVRSKPEAVAFYVDGRRRSVAHRRPYRLGGGQGRLQIAGLAVGRHRITVRAAFKKGRVARASTIVRVAVRSLPAAGIAPNRFDSAVPAGAPALTVPTKVATTNLPAVPSVTPERKPADAVPVPTLTPTPERAAAASAPVAPAGPIRGVNANIRNWATAPDEMKALGATWTREDYVVGGGWPKVMAARQQGVQVLAILNPGDEDRVASPDLRSSTVFELVNEPWLQDAGIVQNGWTARTFAATYVRMATTIRRLRPDATLLFPSEIAYSPWLADCVEAEPSIVGLIDGISFHLYTQPEGGSRPENTGLAFERIDTARADARAHGVDVPFWITEFGWNAGDGYSASLVGTLYTSFMQKAAARPWIAATFPYQLGSRYDAQPNGYGLISLTATGPVRLPAFYAVAAAYGAGS